MNIMHIIRREIDVQRQLRHRIAQCGVAHAGFDVGHTILQIDPQDFVHPRGRDDHAVLVRNTSAGQPGARSARDDLDIALRQQLHDPHDVIRIPWKHHGRGKRSGAEINEELYHQVVTFRAGKMVRIEYFGEWSEALEAAGLEG